MAFSNTTSEKILQQVLELGLAKAIEEYFDLRPKAAVPWLGIDGLKVIICLPFAAKSQHEPLTQKLEALLATSDLEIESIECQTVIASSASRLAKLPKVKNIIAVASGKGGVGKSATSVNLAYALMAEGAKVGLLDADIYGPSIPIMLGNPNAQPSSEDRKHIEPLQAFGLAATSIGYFVPAENATIWRGPMASKALQQLVNETNWPELDYLIVDMPPGTGDIQLTLAQQVPVSGAVIVTTPQDLALADANKGIAMFNKVGIPVLGVIENMSYYQCKKCGNKDPIFASDGGQKLASKNALELLGQLPLDIQIREHADGGTPLLIEQADSMLSEAYRQAARRTSIALAINHPELAKGDIDIVQKY